MALEIQKMADSIVALVEELRIYIQNGYLHNKFTANYKEILDKFNVELKRVNEAHNQGEALLRKIIADRKIIIGSC